MKTLIVGAGSIGAALAKRIVVDHICKAEDLILVERDEARGKEAARELGCSWIKNVSVLKAAPDIVVASVKPKDADEILADLRHALGANPLFISVMAGISIGAISEALGGYKRIIRAMPNLAVRVALGMTVYAAHSSLGLEDFELFERVFGAAGKTLRVKDETLLDPATAVSGSGPAYVFYLIEKMMEAGMALGFSETEAEILVAETFRGATELWRSTGSSVVELRKQVTTPGGTTAAAFEVFDSAKLGATITQGISAANRRSAELGADQAKRASAKKQQP